MESLWKRGALLAGGCALPRPAIEQREIRYDAAWRTQILEGNGNPVGALREFLARWERDAGMRVDIETGMLERIPTPGPAYAEDAETAARCK